MNKFIAEIGLNHMGNEKVAFKMIEKASKTGVWGITLQVAWESYYAVSYTHLTLPTILLV